ncbi:MAG: hypothetical protein ACE5IM_04255 [Nitrospinota bacterium]
MARWPSAREILLIGAGTLFFLLGAEVILRFSPVRPSCPNDPISGLWRNHPALDYEWVPGFRWTYRGAGSPVELKISSQGLRDVEHGPPGENEFRILTLGDSYSFARSIGPIENIWMKVLGRLLQRNMTPPWRVVTINAGVEGYGTDNELAWLRLRGSDFQANLVLLAFYVGNDFLDNLGFTDLRVVGGHLVRKSVVRARSASAVLRAKVLLYSNSALYRLVTDRLRELRGKGRDAQMRASIWNSGFADALASGGTPTMERAYAVTEGLMRRMKRTAEGMGGRLVLIIIPHRVQVYAEARRAWLRRMRLKESDLDLGLPSRRLMAIARRLGIPALDLLPLFQRAALRGRVLYGLGCDDHWNADGHAFAARAALRFLQDESLIPNRSGRVSSEPGREIPLP